MSGNGKGFKLRNYLEVHSLSSDQVFLSIQSETFLKFSGWTLKIFLLVNFIIVYLLAFSYHLIAHEYDFCWNGHKKNVTNFSSRVFDSRSMTLKL